MWCVGVGELMIFNALLLCLCVNVSLCHSIYLHGCLLYCLFVLFECTCLCLPGLSLVSLYLCSLCVSLCAPLLPPWPLSTPSLCFHMPQLSDGQDGQPLREEKEAVPLNPPESRKGRFQVGDALLFPLKIFWNISSHRTPSFFTYRWRRWPLHPNLPLPRSPPQARGVATGKWGASQWRRPRPGKRRRRPTAPLSHPAWSERGGGLGGRRERGRRGRGHQRWATHLGDTATATPRLAAATMRRARWKTKSWGRNCTGSERSETSI